jgi:DNA-binding SARP family transcriptional activator
LEVRVEFLVLGPLTVVRDGAEFPVASTKVRTVLALLLVHARQVVPPSALIDELWPDAPPSSATNTLQTYISQLRRLIGASADAPSPLLTRPGGYLLEVPPEAVDSLRFERLVRNGRQAIEDGDYDGATVSLQAGLDLWRGAALADVPGAATAREAARLEQLRLTAHELRITADLAMGRHSQTVGELQQLLAMHPWREDLVAQLMTALYRCNRQAEALATFREFRAQLVEEHGVEPATELQQMYQRVLNQDDALRRPTDSAPVVRSLDGDRATIEAPSPSEAAASTLPVPPLRANRRGIYRKIALPVLGLCLIAAIATGIIQQNGGGAAHGPTAVRSPELTVSLDCEEPGCRASSEIVQVNAHVQGPKPADRELYLMVYSQNDDAWFIYYNITPNAQGRWSQTQKLGNPTPQPRDRRFKLCAYLLPADTVEPLRTKQVTNNGKGMRASDLPPLGQELKCIAATRPANV